MITPSEHKSSVIMATALRGLKEYNYSDQDAIGVLKTLGLTAEQQATVLNLYREEQVK